MNFPLFISRRLRLRGPGQRAGATGVAIAVAGVALALVVMELTIAVVGGFRDGITSKLTGFENQISVQAPRDAVSGGQLATLEPDSALMSVIAAALPPQATITPRFDQPALLKTPNDFAAVVFTAYGPGHDDAFERGNIVEGELPDFFDTEAKNSIVVSRACASSLQLETGSKIDACFFTDGALRMRRYTVAGIYDSGFAQYDNVVALASLPALQSAAAADSVQCTSLAITGLPIESVSDAAAALQTDLLRAYNTGELPYLYPVDNVTHTGALYFAWLSLLDTNVTVIFILMLCVAAFTLISSMFIIILDRIAAIGVMRALGATKGQIRAVFVLVALRVAALGMLIGNVAALALIFLQWRYQIVPLDPEAYYLSAVPVLITPWQVIALNIGVLAATVAVLIIPSALAAKISPARTMRYE